MGIHQTIAPTDSSQDAATVATGLPGAEADALEAALADMTAAFSSDFLDGRIGERHNSYEHRARVLRQMTAKLSTMRAQDVVATA